MTFLYTHMCHMRVYTSWVCMKEIHADSLTTCGSSTCHELNVYALEMWIACLSNRKDVWHPKYSPTTYTHTLNNKYVVLFLLMYTHQEHALIVNIHVCMYLMNMYTRSSCILMTCAISWLYALLKNVHKGSVRSHAHVHIRCVHVCVRVSVCMCVCVCVHVCVCVM